MDLDLGAYTIARLCKTIFEVILLLKVIVRKFPRNIFYIPKMATFFHNTREILICSLQSSLGTYGELMSFELCTFYVAGLKDIHITGAWVIF